MFKLHTTLRSLYRSPAFSFVSILTLALGIAAAVSVFALVDGVLLRQLPYPNAKRVVQIDHAAPALDLDSMGISHKLFGLYETEAQAIDRIALYNTADVTLLGDGSPERRPAAHVSPAIFEVLGVSPLHGRAFAHDEGQSGADDAIVILGHRLFDDRFGGDASAIGEILRIDGVAHEVVGVMPEGFAFPDPETDLWRPQVFDSDRVIGSFNDSAVARLAPGASIDTAQNDLARLTSDLTGYFPDDRTAKLLQESGFVPAVRSRLDEVVGGVRQVLWSLLAAVGLILAVACANVANLFLVRVEERGSEIAVRAALGASRRRLVRELLGESLVLAAAAGALGLGIAWLTVRVVARLGPGSIPRLHEVGIDVRVAAFAGAVALAAGVIFGLVPALRATRRGTSLAIDSARGASAGRDRHRLRNTLVGAQMAFGLVLLIACGLVVRSFMALQSVHPGFEARGAVTFRLALPQSDYPDPESRVRFVEQALEALAALPGATSAGVASYLPLSGEGSGSGFSIEGREVADGAPPTVFMNAFAGPGTIEAMGIPLIEGRTFEADDHRQRKGNLLVSEGLARKMWPGESAIGKRMTSRRPDDDVWYTVVGVVGDTHYFGLDQPPPEFVYRPLLGLEDDNEDLRVAMSFVVRTDRPPSTLAPDINRLIGAIDDTVPVSGLTALGTLVERAQARMSFAVTVLLLAAVMALVIAAVGLYGTISYLVSRRHNEIGIRMALGARQTQVGGMVLRQGMVVASIGAGIGIALSLVLAYLTTRFSVDLLYAISAFDPPTFLVVPVILLAVAAIATSLPALRATRVAPVEALRHQ